MSRPLLGSLNLPTFTGCFTIQDLDPLIAGAPAHQVLLGSHTVHHPNFVWGGSSGYITKTIFPSHCTLHDMHANEMIYENKVTKADSSYNWKQFNKLLDEISCLSV